MAASNRLLLIWRTHRGTVAKLAVCVAAAVVDPTGVVVQTIRTLIAALSKAQSTKAAIGIAATFVDTPTVGPFCCVEDKAVFTFRDVNGKPHLIKVTAPKAAIFLSDSDEVNLAKAEVAMFVTAVFTNAKTAAGDALTSCLHGRRWRTKLQTQ